MTKDQLNKFVFPYIYYMLWNIGKKMFKKVYQNFSIHNMHKE